MGEMIKVGMASVEAVFDWKTYLEQEFGYPQEQLIPEPEV
jgi:hypothetical protein